ncbi:MAG: glutamate--cysteine ligase, partial [Rhodospirillaceae bacterium]|nr:glutamate--cysteine ligase [Rhodospirillaceae bacterium]
EDGFGFERWVDYILDVPMYFIYRSGVYQNVAGRSFLDYMDGNLEGHIGELPTMDDWTDHMTTAFPEVRLKHFIEMRGADGGPWRGLCALPALWVGLLYDSTALDAAWDLCKDWSEAERTALRDDAPRLGLKTPFRSETIREIALRVLEISRAGLVNRRKLDRSGKDETMFLDVLDGIADSGVTAADAMLEAYQDRWNGDIDKLYGEYSY